MDNPSKPSDRDPTTSRRTFLKNTTAVVAATGLGISRTALAAGSDTIRIALIGCGGRGAGAAYQAMNVNANVKLIALADTFRPNLDRTYNSLMQRKKDNIDVPEDRKFVGLDAYKKAIATDADMVLICTPPGFRPAQYEESVAAGRHVFMEKPLAVDAPGYRRILRANNLAKQKGLCVGVGHHLRHETKHTEVIEQIHDGRIGDIMFLRAYFNTGRIWVRNRQPGQTEMQYQVNNWYHFNWLSGDHIVEQHVHDLDVCNWMMKDTHPIEAQSLGGRQVREDTDYGEIFDHHAVEYTYPDAVKMFSYCRQINNCWNSFSEHAQGTKGRVDIEGHGTSVLTVNGQEPQRRKRGQDGHQVEHDHLFEALLNGRPYNEVDRSATSTMIAIMGRMASYSGRVVTWDQAVNSTLDLSPAQLTWDADPPVLPRADGEYALAIPGLTKAL